MLYAKLGRHKLLQIGIYACDEPDWDAKRWSCWDSKENEEKDVMVLDRKHMEGPISQTRNTKKSKNIVATTAPASGAAPVQKTR